MEIGENSTLTTSGFKWTDGEIRNPKDIVCMDGSAYDGENPKEPIDATSQYYDPNNSKHVKTAAVKSYWLTFLTNVTNTTSNTTKDEWKTFVNHDDFIDDLLASAFFDHSDNWCNNGFFCTWDAQHWSALLYDMDITFGIAWDNYNPGYKEYYPYNHDERQTKAFPHLPWLSRFQTCFWDEIKDRYAQLRRVGIFSAENVVKLMEDFSRKVGSAVYADDTARWPYPSFGNPPSGEAIFYDSVQRVEAWISKRIGYLDARYSYNQ